MWFTQLTFRQLLIFFISSTATDVKIRSNGYDMPVVSFTYRDSCYYMEYCSPDSCGYWEVVKDKHSK